MLRIIEFIVSKNGWRKWG